MIKKITDKDKKDWLKFVKSNEKLENKDSFHQKQSSMMIEKSIDLHGYSLDEANKKIEELITHSYNNGVTKLTIVTGKGLHSDNEINPYVSKDLSILKYSVPDYIKNSSYLMSMINDIKDAIIEDGGQGAFYIFLKNKFKK